MRTRSASGAFDRGPRLAAFFSLVFLVLATPGLLAQSGATLRPGQVFGVHVRGVSPEVASRFDLQCTIGQQGTILIPDLGEMPAAGLTPAELGRAIEKRLVERKVTPHPTVVIDVAQARPIVVVSGGVRFPQRFDWSPALTVAKVIAQCGGLDDFSSGRGIRVVRQGKIYGDFNLKEVQKKPARDMMLQPGDQVIVPE